MSKIPNHSPFLYWGKANKEGGLWHPAVCHMIDVGIVAQELLVQPLHLRNRILSLFGHAEASGLAFFAALHDIGKISPGFQGKRMDLCGPLKELGLDFSKYAETRHGKVVASCLPQILEEDFACPEGTASCFSQVLAAHHGVFVGYGEAIAGGVNWDNARRDVVRYLADLFQIKSLETVTLPSTAEALVFAGLLTMADWIGSSEADFPYTASITSDIQAYIADRTNRAKAIIRKLSIGSFVGREKSFTDLFPFPPNPCQEAVLKVAAKLKHPMLIVIESPTGTGKTEAAQAAFSSIAFQNGLRGMYYALPTQATSNAMFPRMKTFLDKVGITGQAELHLLHSNAELNSDYEDLRLSSIEEPEGNVVASSWFTARKRAILASYGLGTIDQALLAVLRIRHFFLRLFGLSGKLLVFDEVHAYDAYMTEEIFRLIGWLSYCESSIFLLSATLPRARRQKLVEAFSTIGTAGTEATYPCIIGVDTAGNSVWEKIVGLPESYVVLSPVIVSLHEKAEKIIRILREKLAEGGCAACILNTVSEAQAIYKAVEMALCDADIFLFHSRFTLERRLRIEEQIISRYSKGGGPRKGIVIATQVLEQSLDVDFDLMVSDLAPIDLLLQRLGRLHRHSNTRPAKLEERVLYVLMPDILTGPPDFGGSKYVYFPDILSRTALLFVVQNSYQSLRITLPYGVSDQIEAVYGNEDPITEVHLQDTLNKWIETRIGTELAKMFAAREVSLVEAHLCQNDPQYLERLTNDNDDEQMISSRLARQNVTLVILKDSDSLSVMGKEARVLFGKSLTTDNIYLVRHYRSQDPPSEWRDAPLLRHCRPLVMRDGKAKMGGRVVSYNDTLGLQIIKDKEVI